MEQNSEVRPVINQAFIEKRPLSPSSMKAFRKSPRHYMDYLFGEKKEKPAYTMGNLVDFLLTQPDKFEELVMLYEKPNLRTNAGKEEMALLKDAAAKGNLQLATAEEVKAAKKCVDSAMSVDFARELIENRVRGQIGLKWRHKRLNLPIRGFVDFESNAWGEDWIVEVKTTGKEQGADPDKFIRDAMSLGYDIQGGAYLDAYKTKQYRFPYLIFLALEVVEPFNCSVNFCDAHFIERAKKEWLGTLAAFRYCMDNNLFHQGYEFRLQAMDYFSMNYPNWVKPLFENFDIENQ